MIVWCAVLILWCSKATAMDPMMMVAKARLQAAHLHNQATAHIHELRLAQPPPPMHTAVLPTFSVSYPRVSDPRTLLHLHHHHVHHDGAGFHRGGGFLHHHIPKHIPHHVPIHVQHKPPGIHLSQTIINNVRARQNLNQRRYKRALPNIAAARLAVDPNVKLDLIGTLDNVKEATKDIVEHSDSPLYHIRDAMGSARDVFFSIMKMTPTGLLVPTTYKVTQLQDAGETVGAINTALLKGDHLDNDLPVQPPIDEAHDTLNTVQLMLRDGFRSARNSAQHVGDTVHSVRKAVLSAPRSAVKLLLPYLRVLELRKANKQPHLLGAAAPEQEDVNEIHKFVGAGKLMELVRAAAARNDSGERVAAALPCPKEIVRSKAYKEFMDKVRQDLGDIGLK